jgi:hypothetical protein
MVASILVGFFRIYKDNPFFKDCYYRFNEDGEKVYYVKIGNVMKEIGRRIDGISERNIREHRDALTGNRQLAINRECEVNNCIMGFDQKNDQKIYGVRQTAIKAIREAEQQPRIAKNKGEELVKCFCRAIQMAKSQKFLKPEKLDFVPSLRDGSRPLIGCLNGTQPDFD